VSFFRERTAKRLLEKKENVDHFHKERFGAGGGDEVVFLVVPPGSYWIMTGGSGDSR